MVRCIAKTLAAMVHLRNRPLMGSLFPLAWVSFEEISRESIDEVPVSQGQHANQKKIILPSRLLLSNGRFIFLDPAGCGAPSILPKINTTATSP